jgi:hypothetical protein
MLVRGNPAMIGRVEEGERGNVIAIMQSRLCPGLPCRLASPPAHDELDDTSFDKLVFSALYAGFPWILFLKLLVFASAVIRRTTGVIIPCPTNLSA